MPANELFVALALRKELLILFVVFCISAKNVVFCCTNSPPISEINYSLIAIS